MTNKTSKITFFVQERESFYTDDSITTDSIKASTIKEAIKKASKKSLTKGNILVLSKKNKRLNVLEVIYIKDQDQWYAIDEYQNYCHAAEQFTDIFGFLKSIGDKQMEKKAAAFLQFLYRAPFGNIDSYLKLKRPLRRLIKFLTIMEQNHD